MAVSETDFSETAGYPGLVFPFFGKLVETGFIQEEKEACGGFPLYGVEGGGDKVYATFPDGGYFKGIAIRTRFDGLDEGYGAGDAVSVLRKGRIWVRALGEVVDGQAAYVDTENNGITATSTGTTAISGGTFRSTGSDGSLVVLEII